MIPLTAAEFDLLRRTPITEAVPRSMKGISAQTLNHLPLVVDLRLKGLITITLDWDSSTAGHVSRTLAITSAGTVALLGYRQRGPAR
jgi:hypothetical protein